MKSDISRLCLGTAQFGSHYGATNRTGKPAQEEMWSIVDCAYEAGIRWVDTATSYRGPYPLPHKEWNVIYKVKAGDFASIGMEVDGPEVMDELDYYAILAHEPEANHLVRAIKAAGYKGKVGQSVYCYDEIDDWSEVVQFPFSVADRRMEGFVYEHSAKSQKFARSIFLQGKLLEMGYSVSDCLGYVLRQPIDYAIVGVNSVKELEEIIRAAEDLPESVPDIPMPNLTPQELDPRTWR